MQTRRLEQPRPGSLSLPRLCANAHQGLPQRQTRPQPTVASVNRSGYIQPTMTDPDLLYALLPQDGTTRGNGALRESLGWSEKRYDAARDALLTSGRALKGQGRGGTLRRANAPAASVPATPTPNAAARARPQSLAAAPKAAAASAVQMAAAQHKPADQSLSAFIWSVADLLRGDYRQSDYAKVILPFTVLRRLDYAPAPEEG